MVTFMTIFGWVWFVISILFLISIFYLLFVDKERKEEEKRIKELIANTEPDTSLQKNIILQTLNSNILYTGMCLICILGIFFSSIIIYLYR
jgi:putative exporter of polyketide antibiotics